MLLSSQRKSMERIVFFDEPLQGARCEECPIKSKVLLYKEAGRNDELAVRLATEQRIGLDDLSAHFDKTADTILIGCKTQILCRKYDRIPL